MDTHTAPQGQRERDPGVRAARGAALVALGVAGVSAAMLGALGQPLLFALVPAAAAFGLAGAVGRRLAGSRDRRPAAVVVTPTAARVDRSVADLFGQPVIVVGAELFVREFSARAKEIFPALEAGRSVAIALRDPDVLTLLERARLAPDELSGAFTERVPAQRRWRLRVRRTGSDDPRAAMRIVMLLEDVTEQQALERLRVDFVANASHELRTPLASLLGYIETLQGPARNDAAARERFLAIMREQAARMARLIEDLLSLSRAEMRAHQTPRGEADLALAVREIIESLRVSAQGRSVAINLSAPDAPVLLRADRDDLLRLAENLIENALKYGAEGGKVDVTITPRGQDVRLSVRDYGPGIAAEHLPRLTERFYRIDASHSRETGGTGLGLAIVKHIAARHGARLEIDSRPGEGATFSVTFPTS